jgi:hypothetical protein
MLRAALALAVATVQGAQVAPITLELRIFNGADDVTRESRIAVYRAGERDDPLARLAAASPGFTAQVPAGFYDAQVIRVREGAVVAIRWAERLVVMAYPDERGRHLEVINLQSGFGALQVRSKTSDVAPDVALYVAGARNKEATPALSGEGYALFVVPAGAYDLLVRGAHPAWQTQLDVPADHTRLWLVP